MQSQNYNFIAESNDLIEKRSFSNVAEYSVSEISAAIKKTVEENFEYVRVKGEISGLKIATSGHAYFNLKDASSVLACTCWRLSMAKLTIKPEEGLEVIVIGRVTTYAGQSKYQMTVDAIEVAGIGALMLQFERLKALFIAEGLFAPDRKKKIISFPKIIGVVTSLAGAVIKDILHRVEDRCPTHIIIWPVAVQGITAAGEIADAIKGFNSYAELNIPKVDTIIVARGGGSIEDLWAFNEEIVVRAAAASAIPLISAIGHETDVTLIDFAADLRAPTPSAAAELAVPKLSELRLNTRKTSYDLLRSIDRYIEKQKDTLAISISKLPDFESYLHTKEQRLDHASTDLQHALYSFLKLKTALVDKYLLSLISPSRLVTLKQQKLDSQSSSFILSFKYDLERRYSKIRYQGLVANLNKLKATLHYNYESFTKITEVLNIGATRLTSSRYNKLYGFSKILESLDYRKVLNRGFAIVKKLENNQPISNAANARGSIAIEFHDGKVKAEIR